MNPIDLIDAARRFGTPLYVYDGEKIESQYRLLKSCLPQQFEVFYSVKCNPLIGICQLLKSFGSRIEVASMGELGIALEAGFDPSDILFTSPGKTYAELEFAIDNQIYCINIESVQEAQWIHEIAMIKAKKVNIAVRVNPDFHVSGAGLKMTGTATQFGIDETQIGKAVEVIRILSGLNLIGVHVFSGSQMLDTNAVIRNTEEIIRLSLELSETHGFELEFLDLGGGFGIPYFGGEQHLDQEQLKQGFAAVWERYKDRLANTRIGVESGRFLLAESGIFLMKVLYVKESKGTKYLVCDGGSNQHASSAFLGRFVRNNFPMHILGKQGAEMEEVNVVGSLCTPTDVLGQKVHLAKAEPGDLLVIEKSGAYGLTHSPVLFLSHLLPAEVMYYRKDWHVLRERGKVEDSLKGQNRLFLTQGTSA